MKGCLKQFAVIRGPQWGAAQQTHNPLRHIIFIQSSEVVLMPGFIILHELVLEAYTLASTKCSGVLTHRDTIWPLMMEPYTNMPRSPGVGLEGTTENEAPRFSSRGPSNWDMYTWIHGAHAVHNTSVSMLLNDKRSQILYQTYVMFPRRKLHMHFLRLTTGFTDGLSWQLAALGKSQILWVLCHAALRGRQMERFEKTEIYSISRWVKLKTPMSSDE